MREAVKNQDLRGESLGSWFGFCFFILTYNNSKVPLPVLSLKNLWFLGLQRWLNSYEVLLLYKRDRNWSLGPTTSGLQLPLTPAPADPVPSFGFCEYLHTHIL